MMELLGYAAGFILIFIMGWACWQSSLIIEARKKAWRDGTHDYYGNKIDNDDT